MARSESEARVELVKVRALLAKIREDGDENGEDMMYGAQQALVWLLDGGMSPSGLHDLIHELAEELDDV